MKRNVYICFLLMIILVISTYVAYTISHKSNNINCRAAFNISNYGLRASIVATIRTNDNHGVLYYDGPLFKDDTSIGYLSRRVYFTSTMNKESVFFKGNSLTKLKKDNVNQINAEKILPDFFVVNKSEIFLDLVKGSDGYFFIKDNVPILYCRDLD